MVISALVVLAFPMFASAHGGSNDPAMVHACIGNVSKVVRIVSVGGACIASPPLLAETPAHWPNAQVTGPQGPKGDKGDQGMPGTNGANGIDGASVTFAGYFSGNQNGCANGGAIFVAGAVSAYVCNGPSGNPSAARAEGPCFNNFSRFVDCGNGTMTDTVTKLIWLQQADCLIPADWASANEAAAGLKSGDCGLSDGSSAGDWRLPTKEEWIASAPLLSHSVPFNLDFHWSSTTDEAMPFSSWVQDLGPLFSNVQLELKSGTFKVRPVRGWPQ